MLLGKVCPTYDYRNYFNYLNYLPSLGKQSEPPGNELREPVSEVKRRWGLLMLGRYAKPTFSNCKSAMLNQPSLAFENKSHIYQCCCASLFSLTDCPTDLKHKWNGNRYLTRGYYKKASFFWQNEQAQRNEPCKSLRSLVVVHTFSKAN